MLNRNYLVNPQGADSRLLRCPNIQAFKGLWPTVTRDVQCPAGCGPMEYKTKRNLKIRVFDPLGYAMMIAGIPFLAAPDNLPFDFFTSNQIVNTGIGVGLLLLGARRASLVTTDLRCNTCNGVILESKSIDQKLKGDLLGLSENKAEYIRTALSSSTENSEHDCPDCGKKMSHIIVPIERERGVYEDNLLVPDIIEDLTTKSDSVKLDGCKECDLIWFKNAKREQKLSMDTAIIPKT